MATWLGDKYRRNSLRRNEISHIAYASLSHGPDSAFPLDIEMLYQAPDINSWCVFYSPCLADASYKISLIWIPSCSIPVQKSYEMMWFSHLSHKSIAHVAFKVAQSLVCRFQNGLTAATRTSPRKSGEFIQLLPPSRSGPPSPKSPISRSPKPSPRVEQMLERTTEGILKAARLGDIRMLSELHREGYSLLSIDETGKTALHYGARFQTISLFLSSALY